MESLQKTYRNHAQGWYNSLREKLGVASLEPFTWVADHHERIAQYIKSKNYMLNTKKSHFTALSQILQKLGHKDLYEQYSKQATALAKESQEKEKLQEFDAKEAEKWQSFPALEAKREELKQTFEKAPNDERANLAYLIAALYTLQPPIRREYANMEIVNRIPDDWKGGKCERNYLYKRSNDSYDVLLCKDKVSEKRGETRFALSPELSKIITRSLQLYPREYLLQATKKGGPMSPGVLSHYLKVYMDTGIDNLRSAYITYFYAKNPKLADKEKLAELMRHSVATAEMSYRKFPQTPLFDQAEFMQRYDIRNWSLFVQACEAYSALMS